MVDERKPRISKRACPRCKGDGREPGTYGRGKDKKNTPPVSCKRCKGTGWDPNSNRI